VKGALIAYNDLLFTDTRPYKLFYHNFYCFNY